MSDYGEQSGFNRFPTAYGQSEPQYQQAGHTHPGYDNPGYAQPGYAQPGGPGQPYGYGPPQGYPPYAPEHPQGSTVLILGVLGLFVPVVAFIAWYQGSKLEKEIRASGVYYSNAGTIKVGRVLGMVGGILTIVGVGLVIIQLIVMALMMLATLPMMAGG